MKEIRVTGGLQYRGIGGLIDPIATKIGQEHSKKLTVDLSGATFAQPFGIVALATYLDAWVRNQGTVELHCPQSEECCRYLAVSNLIQHASDIGKVVGDNGLRIIEPSWGCETVLPLSRLTDEADLQGLEKRIESRLNEMLGAASPGRSDWNSVKRPIVGTVIELCANILHHADYPVGWIAAQKYMNRYTQTPYLELAIADAGRGVRASLGTSHTELELSEDADAIRKALGGLSCRPQPVTSGRGFFVMKEAARDLNGSFVLRSGDGEVVRHRGSSERARTLASDWPGTFLRVCLSCASSAP